MKPRHGAMRIGRVARWQRRTSYVVLAACALSGVGWFVLADAFEQAPPQLRFWWVSHGATGLLVAVLIGMALPHHVVATWKHHRNRWLGSFALALLGGLALTALLLQYGQEAWHTPMHWVHVGIGIAALVGFPAHVLWGRRAVGRNIRSATDPR